MKFITVLEHMQPCSMSSLRPLCMRACVLACLRACVRACVRVCMRACVCVVRAGTREGEFETVLGGMQPCSSSSETYRGQGLKITLMYINIHHESRARSDVGVRYQGQVWSSWWCTEALQGGGCDAYSEGG